MPYWGASDTAHTHGPCDHCDEILDGLRREEADNTRLRAENERLRGELTTDERDAFARYIAQVGMRRPAMLSDDEVAHEELRRHVGFIMTYVALPTPLTGVDWGRPENVKWLDAAAEIIALVEAPRRHTIDGLLAERRALTVERDEILAENERLRYAEKFCPEGHSIYAPGPVHDAIRCPTCDAVAAEREAIATLIENTTLLAERQTLQLIAAAIRIRGNARDA